LGATMFVSFAGVLGPDWGGALVLAWLTAGVLVLTRLGERLVVTRVLRYRTARQSWLAVDAAGLAGGRKVDVYVAPNAAGVFALGGHTVAVGQWSVGTGVRTPGLQAATATAVAQLRAGGTRADLAMGWWSGPWLLAKVIVGAFLRPGLQSVMRVVGSVLVGMSVFTFLNHGQPVAALLGVCMLADLAIAYLGRRRLRVAAQARAIPSLARAWKTPSLPPGPGLERGKGACAVSLEFYAGAVFTLGVGTGTSARAASGTSACPTAGLSDHLVRGPQGRRDRELPPFG